MECEGFLVRNVAGQRRLTKNVTRYPACSSLGEHVLGPTAKTGIATQTTKVKRICSAHFVLAMCPKKIGGTRKSWQF